MISVSLLAVNACGVDDATKTRSHQGDANALTGNTITGSDTAKPWGCDMSVNPPDGWAMNVGTWGVDADRSDSVFLKGICSMQLKNTAVATKVFGPWIPLGVFTASSDGYRAEAIVRADSNTANFTIEFKQYMADKATSTGTASLISASHVITANTWQMLSRTFPMSNATQWGRFEISKSTTTFNAYIDSLAIIRTVPSFFASNDGSAGTQSIAASTWTDVRFEVAVTPVSGSFSSYVDHPNSTTFTIYSYGYWQINAGICLSSLSDGTTLKVRITDAAGVVLDVGTIVTTGGAATQCVRYSTLVFLTSGAVPPPGYTQFRVQVWHDDVAGARNVSTDGTTSVSGFLAN